MTKIQKDKTQQEGWRTRVNSSCQGGVIMLKDRKAERQEDKTQKHKERTTVNRSCQGDMEASKTSSQIVCSKV